MIRTNFADIQGAAELAMLAAPTQTELHQLEKAVAVMTPWEKENADNLSDKQIQKLAADADVDPANLAIFLNGYALHCKHVS